LLVGVDKAELLQATAPITSGALSKATTKQRMALGQQGGAESPIVVRCSTFVLDCR
jgi:hypothetical protein